MVPLALIPHISVLLLLVGAAFTIGFVVGEEVAAAKYKKRVVQLLDRLEAAVRGDLSHHSTIKR